MRAPTGVIEAIARLRDETLANPRLAALLMLVPLVLVIHVGLLTRDALEDAHTDRNPLARRAARLEALAASGGWAEAIGREEATLARWQSQAWRASSASGVIWRFVPLPRAGNISSSTRPCSTSATG